MECAFVLREHKTSLRLSYKDAPPVRADHPRNWQACAKGPQIGAVLPIGHRVPRAAAVKGMDSLAKPKDGSLDREVHIRAVGAKPYFLPNGILLADGDPQGIIADFDSVLPPQHRMRSHRSTGLQRNRPDGAFSS